MDNSEIKVVVSEIKKLTTVDEEMQNNVWAEFRALGYEETMNPAEALMIIRLLFNSGKISCDLKPI